MAEQDAALTAPISVVIPGRNEADTITRVIEQVTRLPHVSDVVVVDNGSEDDTADQARAAGARVVLESRPGMGHAVRTGIIVAQNDWVMKVDADLDRFDVSRFEAMSAARADGIGLVKGNWSDSKDPKPMTRYLVTPVVARLAPALNGMASVNSGIYLANRRCFAASELVGSYAVDLDVMLRVYAFGAGIVEVDIGTLEHDQRSSGHYSGMAQELSDFFFTRAAQEPLQEWLVLAGNTVLPECMRAFLTVRARVGGRVSVACTSPTRTGVKALEIYPSVTVLDPEARGFANSGTATELYIALPPDAPASTLARARALAEAAPVEAVVVQMLIDGPPGAFSVIVPDDSRRVSARFKRL